MIQRGELAIGCLRWTARSLGWPVLAFFLVFVIGEGAPALMLALEGLATVGYVVAWRWEGAGGGLLAAAGLLLAVYVYSGAGANQTAAALAVGGPLLVIGGLFLASWNAGRGRGVGPSLERML